MEFKITNWRTGATIFTATLGDHFETKTRSIQLGAAVKMAVKARANLAGANLTGANLAGAYLTGAYIPAIPNIDAAILGALECGGALAMDTWHTCETTHCIAGWAVTLAGDAGRVLEKAVGSGTAGALIYAKSSPGNRVPDFYASNERAMAELIERAKATA